MRVLIACEFSGTVRQAFEAFGHDAWSCDLLDTEIPGKHYVGDVREVLHLDWDLMIAHPPCTHLAVSGARWFKEKQTEQAEALEFVRLLMNAPIERIAIENPISIISSRIRKPDQIIQPWQFGHGETKATCLWLKNLPKLQPSNIVEGREQRVHKMPPSPDRWRERSRTFAGIAWAMAQQWGSLAFQHRLHLTAVGASWLRLIPCFFLINPKYRPLHLAASKANRWKAKMNILEQLVIKQTPFTFAYAPQEIVMSGREISVLPALVSELVDMSIDKVKPLERVGRVMIFDVMPHQRQDPPFIFCRDVDLREYYFLWKQVVKRNYSFSGSHLLSLYDEMIKSLNIAKLQTDEAAFMFIELLKFKNEYVRRA